jgi:hypothetical protein
MYQNGFQTFQDEWGAPPQFENEYYEEDGMAPPDFNSFNNMNLGATPFTPQQDVYDSAEEALVGGDIDDCDNHNFDDAAIGHVLEDQTDEEE